ncbi:HET-domain-containing protein, partial [Stipitochalara longipes BDJ]
MRLLNTSSLLMEEFWDEDKTPLYAILSHTWEKEEVTFQHIQNLETASKLIGFSKIQACCRQAFADNFNWIWIDTCCIDKTSSAELSEAINSMFNWYQKSAACYAFLADVPSEDDSRSRECKFSKSRWFTRGWTLQELIAPPEVYFFSKDWIEIGCRTSLCLQIEEITGIDAEVLAGANDIKNKSVAQRMSWAAKRCTTRREDMAYCLMGLFDVNMPLLYGEGSKAFLRLQEEILKRSKDHSLFAWKATRPADLDAGEALMGGFLAKSPSDFEHSNHYVPCNEPYRYWLERPYSMTNMGLCIELPVFAM